MAQHPFTVLERAAVSARIAIHSQDRSGDFRALLVDDEAEGLLALR